MSASKHTYGPTCHLSHTVTLLSTTSDKDVPSLKAQFFYSSPLPIDDPLTAIPTPSGSESRPTKHTPRPYSPHDNNALEEAWMSLGSEQDRKYHRKLKSSSLKPLTKFQAGIEPSIPRENVGGDLPSRAKDALKKKFVKGSPYPENVGGERIKQERGDCQICNSAHLKPGCSACTTSDSKAVKPSTSPANASRAATSTKDGTKDGSPRDFISSVGSPAPTSTPESQPLDKSKEYFKKSKHQTSKRNYETDGVAELEEAIGTSIDLRHEDLHVTTADGPIPSCYSELEQHGLMEQEGHQSGYLQADVLAILLSNENGGGLAQGDAADDNPTHSKHDHSKFHKSGTKINLSDNVLKEPQSKERKEFDRTDASKDNKLSKKHPEVDIAIQAKSLSSDAGGIKIKSLVQGVSEIGTTGFPFQRVPSRRGNASSRSRSSSPSPDDTGKEPEFDGQHEIDLEGPSTQSKDSTNTIHVHHCKTRKNGCASIPVGISRLHLVKLPALQMMPIYWSPVHDIASVTRGTWFYKDTMYPVEPVVANQLEIGYREMRPWSQTWKDELRSALEVGAAGEEKISHRLWPKETHEAEGSIKTCTNVTAADPFCAARCFQGEVAAVGTVELDDPSGKNLGPSQIAKRFPNCQVIYKDLQNAFILKPSLQPSEYYGRKPLAKIKKGTTVGLHVVRGFDWRAWEKLHESKPSSNAAKAEEGASVSENAAADRRIACAACLAKERKPMVTDLVLVIHGIGQKLSERVESFHFTHAINSFRRSVNVELGTGAVQKVLREGLGGIMVLPVNWRSNLSFEDGGPMKKNDSSRNSTVPDFTLKDITPDTIPAVRSLVSDVMLDIPFYMSHHKPKMIEALVSEANRVYRLWCQNNPEFHKKGRVHIIAHSLGSAMALDVLSKQPTSVAHEDLRKKASTKCFEFDTKNLFFAGSPAGFFLLLDKGKLLPRRGRNKPGAEPGDDKEKGIVDEAGVFGCLAVDNLYNIMHYNDPVAYRLNATVDPLYAATLKIAQVPSASTGWLETIGKAVRSITPGMSKAPELGVGQVVKPPVARLPSQLEMEVHDFSREEIAEKKFYLLNDNGQVDYFLSSGGGPLEIQYFNMLSAHSSYWSSADFVRMIVTEIGREPGKSHTLPNMKVVKASQK